MCRILNDVLSLQKIEEGAFQLEMAPFDLEQMVLHTVQSFQSALSDKNITLTGQIQSLSGYLNDFTDFQPLSSNLKLSPLTVSEPVSHKPPITFPHTPSAQLRRLPEPQIPDCGKLTPSKPLIVADKYRLRQVIANFMSNGNSLPFRLSKCRTVLSYLCVSCSDQVYATGRKDLCRAHHLPIHRAQA